MAFFKRPSMPTLPRAASTYFPPGHVQHDLALKSERCRRSLYEFTKTFWDIVIPKKYVDNWHIQCVCEHLQAITDGEIKKLIINIPPGSAKSTLVSVMWPAWEWIDHSGEQSLFGSFDEGLALRDSVKCRLVFESERYRTMFEPKWRMARDQNAKGFYTNTHNGNRYTFGMNAGGKTGWRGDKVVVDDPNDAMDRFNTVKKAGAFETYNMVLSTRVNDLNQAKFLIVQQRIAYDDFTGKLLMEGDWEHLSIPANFSPSKRFFTKIGWTDPRKEEGEGFFNARYPLDQLKWFREIKLGEEGYAAQFNQEPYPAGGSRFSEENFLWWTNKGAGLIEIAHRTGRKEYIRLDMCWTFVSVDLAISEKTSADYTVFSTWAVTRDFDLLLIDMHRDRMREPKIIEKAVALYAHTGYNGRRHVAFLVEENGLGGPISQEMARKGIPVVGINVNRTDKLVRSASASMRMAGGKVFFPKASPGYPYPWIQEFLKELVEFPMGEHDDMVDTLSLASEGVFEVGFAGIQMPEPISLEHKEAHQIMQPRNTNPDIGKRFFKGAI